MGFNTNFTGQRSLVVLQEVLKMTLNSGAELELIYVLWLLVTAVGRICMTILGSLFSVSNSLTRIP